MKNLFLVAITVVFIGAGCVETSTPINNFADCMMAGNSVMESYPRQCTANGVTYVDEIGNTLEKQNLIRVDAPHPGSSSYIASPTTITGSARGTWFFEASFPIEIQDTNGNILGQTHAQATGDWMTEEFVPFTATLTFSAPAGVTEGVLYFRKDNSSGLPEHEMRSIFRFS